VVFYAILTRKPGKSNQRGQMYSLRARKSNQRGQMYSLRARKSNRGGQMSVVFEREKVMTVI
jgi:hypothetical protein